ncbi:uncharacterized protein LOC143233549 [Tachypleus tridentatus]|uniref:uncharacterized protein LOC143233549 n=1 Tax=Tachypleus tridentatus TaxID=6853 RepID=UPI003FD42715
MECCTYADVVYLIVRYEAQSNKIDCLCSDDGEPSSESARLYVSENQPSSSQSCTNSVSFSSSPEFTEPMLEVHIEEPENEGFILSMFGDRSTTTNGIDSLQSLDGNSSGQTHYVNYHPDFSDILRESCNFWQPFGYSYISMSPGTQHNQSAATNSFRYSSFCTCDLFMAFQPNPNVLPLSNGMPEMTYPKRIYSIPDPQLTPPSFYKRAEGDNYQWNTSLRTPDNQAADPFSRFPFSPLSSPTGSEPPVLTTTTAYGIRPLPSLASVFPLPSSLATMPCDQEYCIPTRKQQFEKNVSDHEFSFLDYAGQQKENHRDIGVQSHIDINSIADKINEQKNINTYGQHLSAHSLRKVGKANETVLENCDISGSSNTEGKFLRSSELKSQSRQAQPFNANNSKEESLNHCCNEAAKNLQYTSSPSIINLSSNIGSSHHMNTCETLSETSLTEKPKSRLEELLLGNHEPHKTTITNSLPEIACFLRPVVPQEVNSFHAPRQKRAKTVKELLQERYQLILPQQVHSWNHLAKHNLSNAAQGSCLGHAGVAGGPEGCSQSTVASFGSWNSSLQQTSSQILSARLRPFQIVRNPSLMTTLEPHQTLRPQVVGPERIIRQKFAQPQILLISSASDVQKMTQKRFSSQEATFHPYSMSHTSVGLRQSLPSQTNITQTQANRNHTPVNIAVGLNPVTSPRSSGNNSAQSEMLEKQSTQVKSIQSEEQEKQTVEEDLNSTARVNFPKPCPSEREVQNVQEPVATTTFQEALSVATSTSDDKYRKENIQESDSDGGQIDSSTEHAKLPPFRKGRVDAREHKPRHYEIESLEIGQFVVLGIHDASGRFLQSNSDSSNMRQIVHSKGGSCKVIDAIEAESPRASILFLNTTSFAFS